MPELSSDAAAWLLIGAMACVTMGTRAAGLYAARWVPASGPARRALDAVPGCLLVALLTPRIAQGGPAEWAAAAATLLIAGGRRPAVLAIGAGVLLLILLRYVAGM